MAGIGKVKKEDKAEDSIESLEREFGESTDKIRQLLAGKKDKNSISEEVKTKLRAEYSRAAQIARTLSQRVTDEDEVKKYEDFFKRLSDRAASYGSVIKSRVPKTTFDDVKGLDNVKKLVKSFMFMAQNPEILKYYKLEGGLGMLMYGAPGTGTPLFAESIATAMKLRPVISTPADTVT